MGYDFSVECKPGASNQVVDALSKREEEGKLNAMSTPITRWITKINNSYNEEEDLQELWQLWSQCKLDPTLYHQFHDILFFKGRIILGKNSKLKDQVLQALHDSPSGGHSGYQANLKRIKRDFYWKGMHKDTKQYIRACDTCQWHKYLTTTPAGLLQPLPFPEKPCEYISMDFIEGLLPSKGKTVILVVVDHFTKYRHFVPFYHPYTRTKVTSTFISNVLKLHGVPKTIVSDRDAMFTGEFCRELFK